MFKKFILGSLLIYPFLTAAALTTTCPNAPMPNQQFIGAIAGLPAITSPAVIACCYQQGNDSSDVNALVNTGTITAITQGGAWTTTQPNYSNALFNCWSIASPEGPLPGFNFCSSNNPSECAYTASSSGGFKSVGPKK